MRQGAVLIFWGMARPVGRPSVTMGIYRNQGRLGALISLWLTKRPQRHDLRGGQFSLLSVVKEFLFLNVVFKISCFNVSRYEFLHKADNAPEEN